MRVRSKTVEKFKKRITHEVFGVISERLKTQDSPNTTLNRLICRINSKIQGLRREICPWCRYERVGAPRSWMAFFQVVTDIDQLRDLDKWIREMLYNYMHTKFGTRVHRNRLRRRSKKEGIKSLVNEMYQVRNARRRPCLCDIQEQGHDIWVSARAFFQGRSFETLCQKRPFTVPFVDDNGLQVSVGKRQYHIRKEVFQDLWNRLVKGEQIYRTDLERAGTRNTSHIVALMAELPGIHVTYQPIVLTYKEKPPADFLLKPKTAP